MTNVPQRKDAGIHDTLPPAPAPQLPTFFLRTKLLPPRPAPSLLPRPRLTVRMEQNLAHAVTLVTAPAGSGKTTLVADFLRARTHPFVWYQLDQTDADPLVFLGYVVHGIRQIVAGFGDATVSYMQEAAKELAQQPERAVDVLLNEVLDSVEQQFILVLDDYHHLGADTNVHRVVDRLLAYLPDLIHVIIISRDMPPLALARMRTQASLAVIDRQELLFTDEETRELFRNVFDLELTPEQLSEYRERTHGWITALQLVRQVAQRQALARSGAESVASPDLVEILRQSERDIFDYFAEEVFADEAEDVRRFLLRVSLLERVEPETCSRLYPDTDSSALLQSLVRRNVFVSLASDGRGEEFRLHPLFRSFLQRRFRGESGRAAVASEHARLADYFLEREQWEQAMQHLLAAEDFDRAARTIAERGGAWISAGALGSLASFADALPAPALEAYPRALAHRAEVARLRDEYDLAQSLFNRAASLLHEQGDSEGEAEAFHSLATIARRRGDFDTAFAYLDRASGLTEEGSIVSAKCGNTRGLCLVALGQWTEAEREFRVALQYAEERGDRYNARVIAHNLGAPAGIRGDFGEALRWIRRMIRGEGERLAPPVPQEATAHLNIARCHWHMGDFAACEQHLDSALEICQLFNMVGLRGEIFEYYGNLYREQNELQRAVEFYDRAARAYDEAGIEITRTEFLEERGLLALQMGDLTEARALLDRLIEARARDEMGRQRTLLARGHVFIAQGKFEEARRDLYPALAYFRAHGLYYNESQAAMLLAVCENAEGHEVETLEHLRRALDLSARYDYEYRLARFVAQHPQVFAAPEAAELLPTDLREQLPAIPASQAPVAPARPAAVVVAQAPLADLTVNMLGAVEIFRDPARMFAPDAWVTRRARDILCFIASRRHRRVSKDTIIDTFWGESDFGSVEKNFHPTISHIRKALNSNQPLKQNFLLYRDGDYQLNPEFSYRIDTEEFDRCVAEGDAARRSRDQEAFVKAYEEAIGHYRGEFMQGSYDEWAEEQRSYYREQYLRLIEILAQVSQKAEEWSRSLSLAQRILREDPFREDVHCMIMRAYAGQGNRVAVREQYETLRKLLRKELGVEPAAETQRAYKELVK